MNERSENHCLGTIEQIYKDFNYTAADAEQYSEIVSLSRELHGKYILEAMKGLRKVGRSKIW